MTAIAALCDIVPGWVWAIVCAALLAFGAGQTMRLGHEKTLHAQTKVQFAEYKADVAKKRAEAEKERRDIELHNFRNSERVSDEQTKRETALAGERDALRRSVGGLRDELQRFRSGSARDAASGNTARLAARNDLLNKLFESCQSRYGQLAAEADRVRVQAIGLMDYIRGNSMCSTPFEPTAPTPAEGQPQ